MPRERGLSGLGLSLVILPFSTTAMIEHLLTHISHVVGTSSRVAAAGCFFRKGSTQDTDDARAAPAAPPAAKVRNRRRSMVPPGLVFAAGLRLQGIRCVIGEERLHVAQLLLGYVLGERFFAVRVLARLEVRSPLRHLLVERRDLATGSALGVAGFAVLFE